MISNHRAPATLVAIYCIILPRILAFKTSTYWCSALTKNSDIRKKTPLSRRLMCWSAGIPSGTIWLKYNPKMRATKIARNALKIKQQFAMFSHRTCPRFRRKIRQIWCIVLSQEDLWPSTLEVGSSWREFFEDNLTPKHSYFHFLFILSVPDSLFLSI